MATTGNGDVNAVNLAKLEAYKAQVLDDPTAADRDPTVVARWEGGTRSRVEQEGKTIAYMNGDGEDDLNAMVMLLGSLASCDIEVIAIKAALLGIQIEDLTVEASGHFNVSRLVGVDDAPSPGYDDIEYVITIRAPDATSEQLATLEEQCETASPVGETLSSAVPLRLEFHAD